MAIATTSVVTNTESIGTTIAFTNTVTDTTDHKLVLVDNLHGMVSFPDEAAILALVAALTEAGYV